ncbi:hypothetical protein Vretimale_11488 [Volvox reticuliferus]|uniref:Cleavage/polyadenylation specificity factor A subunit C-terminal domain-containing protein n=1 Tax=Volvox reticuliferus TaxID=1737510 RepID=A0A8J4CQR3_9CHLO|nr:hypothetical protein Vretifemale_14931 [Volvox reticuliferus]GIM07340.1 hypothetical protein Vretimale_11488 [Volvox reticuliferus]
MVRKRFPRGRGDRVCGDSYTAGLTLLHAAGSQAWAAQVLPALVGPPPFPCPAMPKVVGYLPTAAVGGGGGEGTALVSEKAGSAQEPDGLLFLGSDCSNSQIWLVPAAHIAATAKPPPAPPAPPPPPPPPPPAPVTSTSAAPGSSQDSPAPKAGAADGKEEAQQPQAMQTEDVLLPPPLPVLHWPVSELAAIKSLAPVTDIAVVPDSSGADDPWLIASCGRNAAGRLVRARLAAGLQAYLSDGPKVPDGCRMFPLRLGTNFFEDDEQQGASSPGPGLGHTHIAFSFEAVDRTDLLSVAGAGHGGAGGSEFTQVELPGLDHGAASLLVVDVAGRRLVQVTPASVRVLEPLFSGGGLAVEWHAPEPLSLAAHSGSILAAASPTRLHLLRIDPGTGSVTALSNVKQLQAQLSALALYRLPPPPRPPPGPGQRRPPSSSESQVSEPEATYILMGQWLSNRVEVAAVADPARNLLELQLGEDETPRSLTMLDLSPAAGGRATAAAAALPPVLLAGTNTGQLLMWQLVEGPLAARPWRLGPCYSLRVGQVAVGLHPVPLSRPDRPRSGGGGGGYVYVHSHSGALVRPRQQAAAVAAAAAAAGQPSLEQSLEVIRVHGSEGLQALCHVSTTAMPDSTCWVTREGQLLFGRIDPRVKLRWSTAFVGETIHSFAYHAPSHCLVALCESHPIGDNSLRVIEVNSLHQVMSMRLAYGHYHTAITAGPLPCTSGVKAAARRAATMAAKRSGEASTTVAGPTVPEKEFVVLGSYLSVDSSCDPEVGKHVHGAELQYGAVSFLELVANPASDGSNATQYQLLLQGICLVPSVPTSLAIARPSLYAAPDSGTGSGGATDPGGAGSHLRAGTAALTEAAEMEAGGGGGSSRGSGSDPVDMPYLLMGCQGGVRLYRVYVDDGHREGDKAVKRALKLVGQVDELNLPYPKNYTEVQAALEALDKEIKKRAEEEAKEAEAAAKAAAAQGDGAVGMVEGGGAEGGGGKDGGGGGEEDEGLAEDESELPEVEVNWEERLKALAEEEAAENIEWKYGLGLMEQPDSDDEEYFRKWAQERGLEKPPPEAALAVKLLRKRLQREDMLAAEAAAAEAAGGTGGRDSDSGDSSGSSDGGGGAGGRRGRRVVPSIRQLLHDLQRDWAQHVTIVQVDVAKTFGDACVASLACIFAGSSAAGTAAIGGSSGSGRTDGSSSLVLASDFLGSVTVMRLVANSRGAALISCGPDRHPIFAQAAAWLDPEHALVAVHPHGLVVLRRDPKAEEDAMRVALEKAVADFEAGMARRRRYQDVAQVWEAAGAGQARQHAGAKPGGGAPAAAAAANQESRFSLEDLHLLKPQMEATPGLTMNAACRVRHMVTRMCRARLGMRPQPHRHHDHQQPSRHSSASTPSTSRTSTPAISAHGKALPGTGQGVGAPFHHQQWDASDLLLCFSVSGYVAAVRLQHQGPAAAAVPALPPLPPLAKLARLQHAVASLDPVDMALLTGIDSDSYGHSYSWPLVVPRETAAGAGLAGGGSSAVADEAGRRRGTPPLSASAGTSGAGGGGRSTQMQVDGVEEEFMALEAEAEALAAGCVDGSVMRVLLAAAEAQLRKDGESEAVASASVAGGRVGSAGGGGRVAAVLRRLAREVTGAADLGALVGLLQRSSLAGINL